MALRNFLTSPDLFGSISIEDMYPAQRLFRAMIQDVFGSIFMFPSVLWYFCSQSLFGANQFLGAAWYDYDHSRFGGGKSLLGHLWFLHVTQTNYA